MASPAGGMPVRICTSSGAWGPYDLEELLTDAADIAILDQERAGVDIITDGEARRLDGYVDGYYNIIDGIRALPVARQAGPWGYDQQTRYEAIGKIQAPTGLGIVQEFTYLRDHTQKANENHLCWPAHLRLAHSPEQRLQRHRRHCRRIRPRHQR